MPSDHSVVRKGVVPLASASPVDHSIMRKGVVPLASASPVDHSVMRKGVVPLTSVVLPDTHKKHCFECGNTPKMLNKLVEHGIASPSVFPSSLNDFPQLGGTQNQNSQHASICGHHSVTVGPTMQKRA